MKYNIFSILTQVLGRFFKYRDPDFSFIVFVTESNYFSFIVVLRSVSDPDPDSGA